jgi:hypothetical protein
MPFEIFGIPVIICFILGLVNGLKKMKREDDESLVK